MDEDQSLAFGGEARALTPEEEAFLARLSPKRAPILDVWLWRDTDSTPWLLVSLDYFENDVYKNSLRLDFDGTMIAGGWSPKCLNGDVDVRAEVAGVDLTPPDGIRMSSRSPEDLADAARAWFDDHLRRWCARTGRPGQAAHGSG